MAVISQPKRQYRRIQRPKMKICTWCGAEYQAIRSDSLYCSASCATLASLQRLRNAKPEEYEARLKKNAQKAKEKRYEQIEIEKRMKLSEEEKLKQQIEAEREKQEQVEMARKQQEAQNLHNFTAEKNHYSSLESKASWKQWKLRVFAKRTKELRDTIAAGEAKLAEYLDENGNILWNYKGVHTMKLKQVNKLKAELVQIVADSQEDNLERLWEESLQVTTASLAKKYSLNVF